MSLESRIEKVEQDIETLERSVSLKIPYEFHSILAKNGYYSVVSLPVKNGQNINPQVQIQTLNDRMRFCFEIQGSYRVIQYDFMFEDEKV